MSVFCRDLAEILSQMLCPLSEMHLEPVVTRILRSDSVTNMKAGLREAERVDLVANQRPAPLFFYFLASRRGALVPWALASLCAISDHAPPPHRRWAVNQMTYATEALSVQQSPSTLGEPPATILR